MIFRRAHILPTGDEIRNGIVRDTDSPMVCSILRALEPEAAILQGEPTPDDTGAIRDAVLEAEAQGADLVICIGGSGGGMRHDPALAGDFTHSALDSLLPAPEVTELYGPNGHLWCRLVCGRTVAGALVCNLPGPYEEALAAMNAFARAWALRPENLSAVNRAMAGAVRACYG